MDLPCSLGTAHALIHHTAFDLARLAVRSIEKDKSRYANRQAPPEIGKDDLSFPRDWPSHLESATHRRNPCPVGCINTCP
jgi:hypothetical protein